jgi:hypothetical protein
LFKKSASHIPECTQRVRELVVAIDQPVVCWV